MVEKRNTAQDILRLTLTTFQSSTGLVPKSIGSFWLQGMTEICAALNSSLPPMQQYVALDHDRLAPLLSLPMASSEQDLHRVSWEGMVFIAAAVHGLYLSGGEADPSIVTGGGSFSSSWSMSSRDANVRLANEDVQRNATGKSGGAESHLERPQCHGN